MDVNLLRSLVTVAAFVAFACLVFGTWRPRNARRHAEAAELPFLEAPTAGEGSPR